MDITTLQHELTRLSADDQDRIAAFLTVLRMKRDGEMNEVLKRLDDDTPENWVSWEDVRGEFALG